MSDERTSTEELRVIVPHGVTILLENELGVRVDASEVGWWHGPFRSDRGLIRILVINPRYFGHGDDASGLTCRTCGALVDTAAPARAKHDEWHAQQVSA